MMNGVGAFASLVANGSQMIVNATEIPVKLVNMANGAFAFKEMADKGPQALPGLPQPTEVLAALPDPLGLFKKK